MVKTTIKQQLNNIIELQNAQNKKITLKQQQQQQQQVLLNDICYIIDSYILKMQDDFCDNLYGIYNYYLDNKYELINKILKDLKNLQLESIQEIATQKGFEFKKVLVNKHNIDTNNEYQTRLLIDTILKNKINELIKDYKQQQKNIEYLKDNFIDNNDDKSPSKIAIMDLSPLKFLLALIIAIFEVFGSTKKRR